MRVAWARNAAIGLRRRGDCDRIATNYAHMLVSLFWETKSACVGTYNTGSRIRRRLHYSRIDCNQLGKPQLWCFASPRSSMAERGYQLHRYACN